MGALLNSSDGEGVIDFLEVEIHDDHVDCLCGKLVQCIGILRSIGSLLPQNERVPLYFTTLPSNLSLCMVALLGEI